eukprot:Plantae.Rhodophyta-Rhodochaete_pulchella.ctg8271.p1 GENE.Plantae.Rhodophyta-Rhodochaete_pulchella.ctg8271~~Plantae.Rhodophyta-Rhodochaete_pulchella.ctg8271.p1  ORF type:complete len:424 (+),score=56.95 Plantae.Rhodophyta-Rhodochaete_pulchella.ctg8271:49-1272(+)
MLHKLNVEWPALSFDVLLNGQSRSAAGPAEKMRYPLTVYAVAGTQAEKRAKNKVVVMKMSNLYRTLAGKKKQSGESDSESSDDEGDDDEAASRGCILEHQEVKHDGTVNRIRAMPQKEQIVATWSDAGRVFVYDVDPCLQSLDRGSRMPLPGTLLPSSVRPMFSFSGHKTEGFAMNWCPLKEGRMVTGDCHGDIYLWSMKDASAFSVDPSAFRGHKESVEDLQWSPSEENVFASCSVDKSVRFWDVRQRKKAAISIENAHDLDVNVISWNSIDAHLLVSGGDEGAIKVWDLRNVKDSGAKAQPAADFQYHQKAITSVDWHPQESSMLAAASDDHSCSIWDLAVERDPEEEAKMGTILPGAEDLPPQLLFIHLGQTNIKEIHWHPGLPSVLLSTAEDGFNIFRAVDMF